MIPPASATPASLLGATRDLATLAMDEKATMRASSMFIFSGTNRIRKAATNIIGWTWFDRVILALILLNCVFMCIGKPRCASDFDGDWYVQGQRFHDTTTQRVWIRREDESCAEFDQLQSFLDWLDTLFTALFSIEMLLKMVCLRIGARYWVRIVAAHLNRFVADIEGRCAPHRLVPA
jgi:hypothetical protein